MKGSEEEIQFDRNLRLWSDHFLEVLACTVIAALDLDSHPDRSESYGILITALPRPHQQRNGSFLIDGVAILPLPVMRRLFEKLLHCERTWPEYLRVRERVTKNKFFPNFAAMLIIGLNEGEHMLPDALGVACVRFIPLPLDWYSVGRVMENPDWKLDWDVALRLQVRDYARLRK